VSGKKILEVRNCSKSFPGVQAFEGVDFDLHRGEIHCIVGENGAGKSTFIKILSGSLRPDEGTIRIEDREFDQLTPTMAHELGIRTIYQEIHLIPDLSVAENIYVGDWPRNRAGFVDFRAMRNDARELLGSMKIDLDVDIPVRLLGVAKRQSVQIAKALAQDAQIFILDEPTAAFNAYEVRTLLDLVRNCAAQGIGVIYISHHISEVFDIHNRITVLRDGHKIGTFSLREISENELINKMVGRNIGEFYARESVPIDFSKRIEFMNFSDGFLIQDVSFVAHRGEIVGFAGMAGSGRTEIMELVFGVRKKSAGQIIFEGVPIFVNSPQAAIKRGFAFLTEDRQELGLALDHPVTWNATVVKMANSVGEFINEALERKDTQCFVDTLKIKTSSLLETVRNLSGGNQQKVVLSKWLLSEPELIIFDEPTRGIDIGAKEHIYQLIVELARAGKYILLVSSDMPELIAMCDRVYAIRNGQVAGEISKIQLSEETVLNYCLGGQIVESE